MDGDGGSRRALLVSGALFAVAVAVAAVLLADSDAEKAADRPTTATDGSPERLVLGAAPLWRSPSRAIRNTGGVQLRDGLLLTTTPDAVSVVDVATGKRRWTTAEQDVGYDPAYEMDPFLVGQDDSLGVLVTYRQEKCRPGLALLSARDGDVGWRAELPGCVDLWLAAADESTALVAVLGEDVRTVAVDVGTGRTLWEHRGAWPYGLAGGMALVSTSGPWPEMSEVGTATRDTAVHGDSGTITALDQATGEPRWRGSDRYPVARPVLLAGDIVAVATADAGGGNAALVLLAAASGREVAVLSDDVPPDTSCATDGTTLLTCTTAGHDRLAMFQVDAPAVRTVPIERPVFEVLAVAGDWITARLGAQGPIGVVDRRGNPVGEPPPGVLLAVAGDVAIYESAETTIAYQIGG